MRTPDVAPGNNRRPEWPRHRRPLSHVIVNPAPSGHDGHWRIRHDKVNKTGRVTLRHGGRLHRIGLGYEHNGTTVRILIHDLHSTVVNADTGELIRDLTLEPTRDYQPLGRPPGPPKGSPQRGGRKPPTHTKSRDTS